MKNKKNNCPVCGLGLNQDPWEGGLAHEEIICSSCGTQFGYHDAIRNEGDDRKTKERYLELRKKWVDNGSVWNSKAEQAPKNWDYKKQLENIPEEFK